MTQCFSIRNGWIAADSRIRPLERSRASDSHSPGLEFAIELGGEPTPLVCQCVSPSPTRESIFREGETVATRGIIMWTLTNARRKHRRKLDVINSARSDYELSVIMKMQLSFNARVAEKRARKANEDTRIRVLHMCVCVYVCVFCVRFPGNIREYMFNCKNANTRTQGVSYV